MARQSPPDIRSSGYVVDTLEAALWAVAHSKAFEETVLKAVNRSDDADRGRRGRRRPMGIFGDARDLDAAPRLGRMIGCDRLRALGGLIIDRISGCISL